MEDVPVVQGCLLARRDGSVAVGNGKYMRGLHLDEGAPAGVTIAQRLLPVPD